MYITYIYIYIHTHTYNANNDKVETPSGPAVCRGYRPPAKGDEDAKHVNTYIYICMHIYIYI